ncbi:MULTISPECIES: AI-2E family transporter [Amycolatopsis]|uniref:AI-2E family transporter n=1 Tax=Amycolatopsis tucumanensis TaxID=401106 RepID=A0ABP7HNY6_9PSEU|nr:MULTISPECIES: AI-2E family transporter [Amycolatopsis]MCF6420697.1 AI-2E family transporter [Amycolatopsis tucumanensis]
MEEPPNPRLSPDGLAPSRDLLPRALVVLLGAAAVVVVVAGVRAAGWLVGPVFTALVIVIAVSPVQDRLRRRGWPAWLTTTVLVILVYGVLALLTLGIVVSLARLAGLVPQYTGQAAEVVRDASVGLSRLGIGPDQLRAAAESLDLGRLTGLLTALLADIAGLVSNLVFLLALLLFLSVEAGGAGQRIAAIATDRPSVSAALRGFTRGTRRYLVVTTVFGLVVAALDALVLAVIGIPLALTWGLLSFVTNYIPNVGFLIGLAPPAILGLLTGGVGRMVLVIVCYGVINFVLQSLIQPRFVGDAVGLSVTVTFVALVFWAWLLGPLGAILAIPMTLLAKALLVDLDPRARWADVLLRSGQRGPPESRRREALFARWPHRAAAGRKE